MRRLALLCATTLAALVMLAGPAFAHVTVSAPGATRGGSDQEITFRMPVEKNVDAVGLTIALPTNTPIASVLVQPVAGWTNTQKTIQLAHPIKTDDGNITTAVSQIGWRATAGHGLKPGEFGAFTIIAGQLPDVGSLTFPALEYYADGSVTRWTQVAAAGSHAEPDNPAPVLKLTRSQPNHLVAGSAPADATPSSSNTGATVISIVALVVAAGALGLAVVSRAKGHRNAAAVDLASRLPDHSGVASTARTDGIPGRL